MRKLVLSRRKRWLLFAAAALAGVLVGALIARATPGGETRPALSFAGTLRGTSGMQMLIFTFKKAGATICAPQVGVTPSGATGAFNVDIPLTGCPTSLFDGADVTYDVTVGTTVVVTAQPVNPVPYARYADKVGTPDCPVGYDRDMSDTKIVLCKKGADEVVRVGTGATAFWIDRYEASIWPDPDGTGTSYIDDARGLPADFHRLKIPLYAVSKAGVFPSYNVTWFAAEVACRYSGKRLPTREEWLAAARGTPDPGANAGTNGQCLTQATAARNTGQGTTCISIAGAQDMIGNFWEWTAEWYAAPGSTSEPPSYVQSADYGNDIVAGVASGAKYNNAFVAGLPAAACRGGSWLDGTSSGGYAFAIDESPLKWSTGKGFRCVIPR